MLWCTQYWPWGPHISCRARSMSKRGGMGSIQHPPPPSLLSNAFFFFFFFFAFNHEARNIEQVHPHMPGNCIWGTWISTTPPPSKFCAFGAHNLHVFGICTLHPPPPPHPSHFSRSCIQPYCWTTGLTRHLRFHYLHIYTCVFNNIQIVTFGMIIIPNLTNIMFHGFDESFCVL